jgi:hypothetical protein
MLERPGDPEFPPDKSRPRHHIRSKVGAAAQLRVGRPPLNIGR